MSANLCFDCKFARADLCPKIASRKAPKIKTCSNFEKDCELIKVERVMKEVGVSNNTYYKRVKKEGIGWVIKTLKKQGRKVFVQEHQRGIRIYEKF